MRYFISIALFFIVIAAADGGAAQTSPAEQNPEAVFISKNYGIPQLNGRLLVPGTFNDDRLKPAFDPMRAAWKSYYESFQKNTEDYDAMIGFMMRAPQVMQQLVAAVSDMSPDEIARALNQKTTNGIGYELARNMDQFEMQALSEAMAAQYNAVRHRPARQSFPVTLLIGGNLGYYDFERGQYSISVSSNAMPGVPANWTRADVGDGKTMGALLSSLSMEPDFAQTLLNAAQQSEYAGNRIFVGVEAVMTIPGRGDDRETDMAQLFDVSKVIFALDPALQQPFFIHDAAAFKAADRAVEEQKAAALAAAEESGFGLQERAALFTVAGLRIASPAPDTIKARRFSVQRPGEYPALNSFFHAKVPGGELAFHTDDGTADGNLIYLARAFTDFGVTPAAVQTAAKDRYGMPFDGPSGRLWLSDTVPQERRNDCRFDPSRQALGRATVKDGRWSSQPINIGIDDITVRCGLVAALGGYGDSAVFAVIDTGWFMDRRDDLQRAAEARAEAERQRAEKARIEF